ncbi:MAG: bifunctional N-acetylglucosamine-1-phosphate uridyltransferase/glucosamine-1-phosphate acetyltransferase [Candidatus Omnitrophica bacterium]|nr:bifunctional N-acetylglucosamine-1-phosphate uridyltransferase/glucosamine-1-phosphate acetyltransferase [Candidatus Omnitrophota bacterium]
MRTVHAIILAAGEGTRMKSELPKVLHSICGRPMISYALNLAAGAGVKQPIVVLGKGAELVKPHLPKETKVVLQPNRAGTGDAVLVAKKALGAPTGEVLILYGDTPLLRRTTVQKLIETHFKAGATCTLLTAHLADPSGYGRIARDENGKVVGIIEEAEANAAQRAIREVNVGTLICNTQALVAALATVTPSASKKELYLTQIISHIAKQEGAKIHVAKVEEVSEALGINSRGELARATGVIRQRIVDMHLQNGVTIEDPQSTFIDYGVSIGADTTIRPYTVIETGVSIGKRCVIGPFARLRRGVAVADEVRIGNFVELVRTKVGPRVRINHVSYLGDATIDEGANIGAGTITANYDGKEKHATHIGKGAFIGSDTVLIAPVKVGPGAITGAGSVVTRDHDVPAKGVVVGVPARPLGQDGGPSPARPGAGEGRAGERSRGTRALASNGAPRTDGAPPAKREGAVKVKMKLKSARAAKPAAKPSKRKAVRPSAKPKRPVRAASKSRRRAARPARKAVARKRSKR